MQKKSISGQLQIQMHNFYNCASFKCSETRESEGTTILFYSITLHCIHDCTIRICITGLFVVVVVVLLAAFLQVEATV